MRLGSSAALFAPAAPARDPHVGSIADLIGIQIGQHGVRQLAGAQQQGGAGGIRAQQPSHQRTVGGAAQAGHKLAADLFRILQQPLHPGTQCRAPPRRRRAFVVAPGFLDLAQDFRLAGDLAFQSAGQLQHEAVRIDAAIVLESIVAHCAGVGMQVCGQRGHPDFAQASRNAARGLHRADSIPCRPRPYDSGQ